LEKHTKFLVVGYFESSPLPNFCLEGLVGWLDAGN
jgi:hypothetical protein